MKQFFTKKFRKIAFLLSVVMILTMQSYVPAQAAVKTPAAPTVTVEQDSGCYTVHLSWKNLDKKYSYQIYRSSTSSTKGYKRIVTVKAYDCETHNFSDETPAPGKTNYYRVRAFFKSGGKTIYGKFSSPKKIKVVKRFPVSPIKVGFKGKTATLVEDINYDYSIASPIKTVLNIWGKPSTTHDSGGGWKFYTFKKGKTEIGIGTNELNLKNVGRIVISIKDKNGSLAGVKVGDSKSKAVSTLTKVYGKSAVKTSSDKIECKIGLYFPFEFKLKSGKVSEIVWERS